MRRFIAVLTALALVALVAGPVAAAKPSTFSTDLWIEGQPGVAAGSYNAGFFIPTTGSPGLMGLDLTNTVANPPIPNDTLYPFTLKASDTQKAALLAYFAAKGWPQNYMDQITAQINGTLPFFYLTCRNEMADCRLVDGFTYGLTGDNSVWLRIDNDYPTGTFKYTGDLNGLSAQVKMKVYRV